MARKIDEWLDAYGESHTHPVNKIIHWICVPLIMFSLLGLISEIPFPVPETWYLNWAGISLLLALIYYLRLSISLFFGFVCIGLGILAAISAIRYLHYPVWITCLVVFVAAWTGQFTGHSIEGKKPSFLKDLQFLLIGPAWLLSFIYRKTRIPI